MKKAAVFMISLVLVAGCAKTDTAKQGGPYLAKVDGTAITKDDYDRELASLPEYASEMFGNAAGREKFLTELINKEVLYREAIARGLDKNEEFKKKLEEFKKLSLVSMLFESEVMTKAKVSDQEVKDYYEKNKADFAVTTEIRASHILVKTDADAAKALSRLEKGEKFADVAKALSIDKASARNGGDLGFFKRGQMVPAFEQAAAALKPGQVSKPVRTEFGYHIILVTDKKKGQQIEFERVRDMIAQRLTAERQKEAFDTYLAEAKKKYKIEINSGELAKIGADQGGAVEEKPAGPAEKTPAEASKEKKN